MGKSSRFTVFPFERLNHKVKDYLFIFYFYFFAISLSRSSNKILYFPSKTKNEIKFNVGGFKYKEINTELWENTKIVLY